MTQERLREICEKYGKVLLVQLKTIDIGGKTVSKGTAKVFYETKEEAGVAIQKLYYERELGDELDIEYFKSME